MSMERRMQSAIILCEKAFGTPLGKTAAGLVRYSKKFKIVGVIDSVHRGKDAGYLLEGVNKNIPIFGSLEECFEKLKMRPKWLIIGVASVGGKLPHYFRPVVEKALKYRLNIISGLHEFLAEDKKFKKIAKKYDVKILDIRKEPPLKKMHLFRNLAKDLPVVRIPVLGTDSSIGKRTTAIKLTEDLNNANIRTVFIATGQTGLLQGAKYGIPLDAIQGDYMVGELENVILKAFKKERPEVIIIEGQGSISHPAYVCGTRAIITASSPSGIILQHAPKRKYRNFGGERLKLPMPNLKKEIQMLELFSDSKVIAITINHENMTDAEIKETVQKYEAKFKIPVCDVLKEGTEKIVAKIRAMVVGK